MENKTQERIFPTVEAWQLAFGNAITRVRGKLKMTQEEFGCYVDVSRPTISAWELSNAIPARATLSRAKDKLYSDLTPEELLVFENGPEKIVKPTDPEAIP